MLHILLLNIWAIDIGDYTNSRVDVANEEIREEIQIVCEKKQRGEDLSRG